MFAKADNVLVDPGSDLFLAVSFVDAGMPKSILDVHCVTHRPQALDAKRRTRPARASSDASSG